ncbi:MAG: pyridoxamine 5'-phosphate oxidase family protein [Anaerolineae bacterium]|nr:pyridoxamine 5'-phosphate oxidase family protein [Anaerolineae bacterium]
MNHDEKVQTVRKMLSKHDTAMLVTHNVQGGLVSRPMTAQETEFDGDVWFFVSSDADVLHEIQANAETNVTYSRGDDFLSLSGNASVVDDMEKKKELWYPELKKWFDGNGPESPDVRLVKVSVDTARFWGVASGNSEKQEGLPQENIVHFE